MIQGATVYEDEEATQADDGRIQLSKLIQDFIVHFPTTDLTKYLRLTAYQADLGGHTNFVLTEVIITGNKH